jgi:hypothetical protein
VLWSPGGNRWEELTPHGVDTVVAVSATALLMAPYPAAERTGPSRDDITRWVEETLVPLADIDPGDVSCLTDDLAAVGAVRPQLDDDPDGSEQARRTGAERYVDVFVDCTSRWEHVFLLTRTEGADQISQPSANCVTDALDDDTARSMWIEEMVGASNDLRHLDPLFDTLDQCLTVEELDRLDWN